MSSSQKEMLEKFWKDVLLPDDSYPPNGWTEAEVNEKVLELESVLIGKNKPILPEPEPEKNKETGRWSENEKRLFMSGLLKYGWSNWKKISSHIGTRDSEQVRSYSRRLLRLLIRTLQDIQSRPIANPGHLPFPRTVMELMVYLHLLSLGHGLDYKYGNDGGCVCYPPWHLSAEMGANPSSSISDQVWCSANTRSSDSYGSLPVPSAYGNNMNPGHLPFPRAVMEPMASASNVPPPITRDVPLLSPGRGRLDDIYGNYGGFVCYPPWNLSAEMGANPSSSISEQVWCSANTLSSDSYGYPPGPSAYGNNMNPGQ